jgi:hypothetical protein
MPRPKRDGARAQEPNKRELTPLFLERLKPQERAFMIWDSKQSGLAMQVQPTGHRSWKVVYTQNRRPRWYTIGAYAKEMTTARQANFRCKADR